MPANPRSKNTEAQRFPQDDLVTWHQQLNDNCDSKHGVLELFQDMLQTSSQRGQLVAIKKIGNLLTSLSSTSGCFETILFVLVEVHSRCSSRHPLQRTIASVLQCQAGNTVQLTVTKHVAKTIQSVLAPAVQESTCGCGFEDTSLLKGIQYIEVLMENFVPGEMAMKMQLPLVLDFCVTTIISSSELAKDNSNATTILIALMKTTTNLMLKLAPEVSLMLLPDVVDDPFRPTPQTMVGGVCFMWPNCQDKRVWTRGKLTCLSLACEKLLMNSGSFPHDATVSAAMLLVATYNITLSLLELPSSTTNSKQSPLPLDKPRGGGQLVDKIQCYLSEYSQFAQLSLCHALLAKLPVQVITGLEMEDKPLLLALFPIICQLFRNFTESSERYIASRTLALWTSVARTYACDISLDSPLYIALLPSGPIVQTLLQYIWSLWEDPIDGIRHQCKEMFENIIKTYKHLQVSAATTDDFLFNLAESLLSLDSPTRGQFILLATIANHVPISKILEASPHLPANLMAIMGHHALACHAGDLWSRLVDLHWRTTAKNEEKEFVWSQTWIAPLITALCSSDHLAREHIVQHCLPSLLQCTGKSLEFISTQLDVVSSVVPSGKKLTARLACLRCAKTHCKEFVASSGSLKELFTNAMHHADEQVRLSALGLICESHRTTEPPELAQLPLLVEFVELNANSQSPGFRHPVLTAFKKLFLRIRDSSYTMLKAYQKNNRTRENPGALITGYKEFLQVLSDQQFKELHPLSSFQRRNFSLSLLQLLMKIFDPSENQISVGQEPRKEKADTSTPVIPPVFEFSSAVTKEQAMSLVDGLRDPFDANRQLCLELLLKLQCTKVGLDDPGYVRKCVKSFVQLVSSPKSVNCTSAAFLLKLLTHFVCEECNHCLSEELGQALLVNKEEDPYLSTLILLCELLRHHIASAEQNLVQASVSAPIYGTLQSIRTVLEGLHLTPTPPVCDVVCDLVKTCEKIALIMSPVVCSSSPEGFLPATNTEEGTSDLESQLSSSNITSGNAQSLLLCCWHSMKEIALLLGYLVGNLPVISKGKQDGIISSEQLEVIAGIFIHQLTEARHRGAFEMAYTGFCKLCHCLWTNPSPSLAKKPSLWIQDLLESLQSTSLARLLSITRRSAGLPFYIQAILTSEPFHTGYACCKSTMHTLLKVAEEGVSINQTPPTSSMEDGSVQSQPAAVHALNILRALYRDSKLGDFVVPFIPEGLMIAIEGFSASLWPVRNSSTLLFSALVSRVFGAKRVQDEHSMENKMTSREFFTRFPSLHGFLLDQLKKSVEQLSGTREGLPQLSPSLFPTLLLLSRLYPSPLDEDNSTVTLRPFVPLLVSCTCCPVWKTRVLVSRALASTMTECTVVPLLLELYDEMEMDNQNKLHGSLLVVHYTVRERPKLLQADVPTAQGVSVACWLLETHIGSSHLASRHNPCGITRHLYLDILHSLLETVLENGPPLSSLKQLHTSKLEEVFLDASQTCFSSQSGCTQLKIPVELDRPGLFGGDVSIAYFDLLLLAARHPQEFSFETLSLSSLVTKSITSYSCLSVCIGGLGVVNTITESEYLALDHVTVTAVSSRALEMVMDKQADSELLIKEYSFLAEKFFLIRKDLEEKLLASAFHLCIQLTNRLDLTLSLIQFVSSSLPYMDMAATNKYLPPWIDHLEKICIPTQPYEIRMTVAEQLPTLWPLALDTLDHGNQSSCEPLSTLCRLVITLLQDADLEVRMQIATAVVKILPGEAVNEVESPNPSSALRWFIASLPVLLRNLTTSFNILLSLLPPEVTSFQSMHTLSQDTPPSPIGNLLFDEDPINDYSEDVVILQLVVRTLKDTVHKLSPTQTLTADQVDRLVQVLPSLSSDQKDKSGGKISSGLCVATPWEDSTGFMHRTKMTLLVSLLETVGQHLEGMASKEIEAVVSACIAQCCDALNSLKLK